MSLTEKLREIVARLLRRSASKSFARYLWKLKAAQRIAPRKRQDLPRAKVRMVLPIDTPDEIN